MIEAHTKQEVGKHTMNYEGWVRTKEHQEKLKKVLVLEAKKDMYEKLVKKQAELDQLNQDRAHNMYSWEEKKHIETVLKKRDELRKKEMERLTKIKRQEESHQKFKQWLKDSIVKQQRDVYIKKLEAHEKRMEEEEKKKLKDENEVMAKIAYKVWKEKKTEEARN